MRRCSRPTAIADGAEDRRRGAEGQECEKDDKSGKDKDKERRARQGDVDKDDGDKGDGDKGDGDRDKKDAKSAKADKPPKPTRIDLAGLSRALRARSRSPSATTMPSSSLPTARCFISPAGKPARARSRRVRSARRMRELYRYSFEDRAEKMLKSHLVDVSASADRKKLLLD